MKRFSGFSVTPWMLIGAIGVAGILSLFLVAGLSFLAQRWASHQNTSQKAILTVIPAPTVTPTPLFIITETPEIASVEINGISIGVYVQISGTGGDGLRLRSGPGKEFPPLFLGYESEVFEVKDGPKFSDGITWWYLVAPYDQTRSGWAASDYLKLVTVELEKPSQ
ncbi:MULTISPECIES: SH3 domain-containing protein [Anaerolinea]|uniref:SH3 domain-containing protein n=1 Tax=Anaerolinea TaxID=233189 RepID=UPI002610007B|nr:SH3 domain-containing protein [Anaerolinea thermophila]